MRVLCLSNGHGEDQIGARVLAAIQAQAPETEVLALPLVGLGHGYQQRGIKIAGPVEIMPSGGFIYQDGRQFLRDLRAGLLGLLGKQLQTIQAWSAGGSPEAADSLIVAVGDIVPLALAWMSGCPYGFVGTAKSDYYIRDGHGQRLPGKGWAGSDYLPWERWLLGRPACQAVFPRDSLTTKVLAQFGLPVFDCGNPMMDELPPPQSPRETYPHSLILTLLPGSRVPEAHHNWHLILDALDLLPTLVPDALLLAALSPGLDLSTFITALVQGNWQPVPPPPWLKIADAQAPLFQNGTTQLLLSQRAYSDCLHLGDVAIALAGTATEQMVGLGKPVITFAGPGPQFTRRFAQRQAQLLGISVQCVDAPTAVVPRLKTLLDNSHLWAEIQANGQHRLGPPGAAAAIAQTLLGLVKPKSISSSPQPNN